MNIFLTLRLTGIDEYFPHSCLVDWMCRPYKVFCMHAFLCPLFLVEYIGRCLLLPFVLNVIALGFMAVCLFLV